MAFVLRFAQRHPLFTAGVSLSTRYFIGDSFTQLTVEKKDMLDLRRLACFTSFGFLMGAGPIYAWMGVLMPRLIQPRLSSTVARCGAFAFGDILLFMPFVYFPSFYTLREFIYHGDAEGVTAEHLVHRAAAKMRSGFLEDMRSATMVLLPQDILMQTMVPPHLRVPFISATGLVWVYLLSSSRGADEDEGVDSDAVLHAGTETDTVTVTDNTDT